MVRGMRHALFGSGPNAYFRIPPGGFWVGFDFWSLAKGDRVLWKGGKKGGCSTKVEFFSGLVAERETDDFIVVS